MNSIFSNFGYGEVSNQQLLNLSIMSENRDNLQSQMVSGVISETYSGIGDNCRESISIQPIITQVNQWNKNINWADSYLSTMQNGINQINEISKNLTKSLSEFGTKNFNTLASDISNQATQDLNILENILNIKQGNTNIFPYSKPSSESAICKSVKNDVQQISSKNISSVLKSCSDTISKSFSTKTNPTKISIGKGENVSLDTLIGKEENNENNSKNSPIQDLLRNLYIISALSSTNLKSSDSENLIQKIQSSNLNICEDLSNISGSIGITQKKLYSQKNNLQNISVILKNQLGTCKNSDPADISIKLSQSRDQIEASYLIISKIKDMNLTNYI